VRTAIAAMVCLVLCVSGELANAQT